MIEIDYDYELEMRGIILRGSDGRERFIDNGDYDQGDGGRMLRGLKYMLIHEGITNEQGEFSKPELLREVFGIEGKSPIRVVKFDYSGSSVCETVEREDVEVPWEVYQKLKRPDKISARSKCKLSENLDELMVQSGDVFELCIQDIGGVDNPDYLEGYAQIVGDPNHNHPVVTKEQIRKNPLLMKLYGDNPLRAKVEVKRVGYGGSNLIRGENRNYWSQSLNWDEFVSLGRPTDKIYLLDQFELIESSE